MHYGCLSFTVSYSPVVTLLHVQVWDPHSQRHSQRFHGREAGVRANGSGFKHLKIMFIKNKKKKRQTSLTKPSTCSFFVDSSTRAWWQPLPYRPEQNIFQSWSPGSLRGRERPEDHRHHYLLPGRLQRIPGTQVRPDCWNVNYIT